MEFSHPSNQNPRHGSMPRFKASPQVLSAKTPSDRRGGRGGIYTATPVSDPGDLVYSATTLPTDHNPSHLNTLI